MLDFGPTIGSAIAGSLAAEKEAGEVALLQRADAVAQGGGALELEFLGGFAHLDFELREDFAAASASLVMSASAKSSTGTVT